VQVVAGAVSRATAQKEQEKKKEEENTCYPNWDQVKPPDGIYNQLLHPLGVNQTFDRENGFQYSQFIKMSFKEFEKQAVQLGWKQFYFDPHKQHIGFDDFKMKYKGEWYHLSVKRPLKIISAGYDIDVDPDAAPPDFSIHMEEAEPGSLAHGYNWVMSKLRGKEILEYRGIPPCKE
jgi:hypothetical protein